ncbi:aminoacyl-tRNA hydrolase [Helicobacter sp. 11S03491-1]|uniref:aminoacyl-tRNA hydrolase n=1 Tax=Helicobacter sp. 11S03491-1 TaxID=1476196 RepID=UPI000BA71F42|nr:aminoacyl-tRNA hydrolase [Helicobacter sp. 11S03491-1]PAF43449.1 aminoacyl-tRNA hydrolase [Helicobacter sp. 11S03491-1]
MSSLLIAGLGNPGSKYDHTRHNIGFDILDSLATNLGVSFESQPKLNAQVAKFPTQDTFLIKPQTFMNLSGQAIAPMINFYKIPVLFVVHDELDLPLGCIRFKKGGSSGGHNGLKSIDTAFGNDYYRLRFGIGRDEQKNVIDYVLGKFDLNQSSQISSLILHCMEALKFFIHTRDFSLLQNRFTQNPKNKIDNDF